VSKKLRLGVSGVLLAWLAWETDWAEVGTAFAQLRPVPWLAAVGLYVATQILSSVRWQLLARPLGFAQSLRQFTSFYFIGMFFNLLLPTSVGGDVVRAFYLNGGSGRRLTAFLSVFVDRFSGLLVLLALACLAAVLYPDPLPNRVAWSVWGTAGCAIGGLALLPLLGRFTRRLDRARRLSEGAWLYLSCPGLIAGATGLSVLVQAANVVILWLVGQAIDAPVPGGYYWVLVPMVTLLTLLPSIGGLGVREAGMALFLAPLGVPYSTALSLSFLWMSVFMVTSLCGAVVYVLGSFPRPVEPPTGSDEVRPDAEPFGGDPDQGRERQYPAAA
jgi:uncharacterized membrane protein YbhN (UPF0104 family)